MLPTTKVAFAPMPAAGKPDVFPALLQGQTQLLCDAACISRYRRCLAACGFELLLLLLVRLSGTWSAIGLCL